MQLYKKYQNQIADMIIIRNNLINLEELPISQLS